MILRHIREYHAHMQVKGANMTLMAFTRPTKEYKWYSRGWVVSGYRGQDSHKYFHSKQEAIKFMLSREVELHAAQLV